jgi:PHB/PHA accumulation regulator DNA-binding domain/Poly(hydroxyalcanoate) granule associated protein (phasin)
MAAERHLIKKYANRKLYDTRESRYITLEGISRLVRDGHDIEVVDRDTGRDLTPLILSQIVMGEEKRGGEVNGAEGPQDRGQALIEYVRRTLSVPAARVSSEVGRRRSELEDRVELAVTQALEKLSVPSHREVDALNARMDELERKLERVEASRAPVQGATPSRRRRAAAAQ